jgi:hypothetical protein
MTPQDGVPPTGEKHAGPGNPDNASIVARELHWLEKLNIAGQMSLVVVGIIAASIYGCQLHVMQRQLDEMKRSGEQSTQQMWSAIGNINWEARSMDWNQKVAKQSIESNERQSRTTLQATIDTFHHEQRAWLSAQTATGAPKESPPFKITFPIVNTGRTPAKNVIVYFNWNLANPTVQHLSLTFSGAPQHMAPISPGESLTFFYNAPPGLHTDPILLAHLVPYVYGAVTYDDVFAQKHWRTYCFFVTGGDAYAYCQEHNEIGDGPMPPEELK